MILPLVVIIEGLLVSGLVISFGSKKTSIAFNSLSWS